MAGEYLWVTEGNAEGTTVALDEDFLVGRSESGEGRLGDDPEISRAHARFYRDEAGRLMVADLGSTNGTFVNETRISAPQALQPGDRVRTGKTTLQVVAPEAAEETVLDQPTPPPPPPPPAYEPAAQQPAAFQPPTQPQEPAAAPGRGRPGWLVPLLAALGALLVIGGIVAVILVAGGDDGGGDELDGPGAEETVKEYLRAYVDGDGDAACDQLTDDYQEEIVERNEAFVDEDVSECPELIEALEERLSGSGGLTFEGEELNDDSIDDLDLKSNVELNSEGEGESATVEGPEGQQKFELEPVDGEWKISDIPSN
jgi:pSer/pThr/pTyr-binding forkhead associated (FHA) protein